MVGEGDREWATEVPGKVPTLGQGRGSVDDQTGEGSPVAAGGAKWDLSPKTRGPGGALGTLGVTLAVTNCRSAKVSLAVPQCLCPNTEVPHP